MRIGLLVCDFTPDEYLSVTGQYIDMFSVLFVEHDVAIVPYDAYRNELPKAVDECDGYIVSGSRSGVYEDEQWISDLEQFIRDAVAANVPMVGVCFGLHAMAEALGGTVEEFDGGWGGGVRTMTVSDQRAWMTGTAGSVSLIVSHQDQVIKLPEGAIRLGSTSYCENFLVEFTSRHVGIQGHPEIQVPFAEAIYRSYRETRGQIADEALATLDRPTDSARVVDWMWNLLSAQ